MMSAISMLELPARHYVMTPPEEVGHHCETLPSLPGEMALLLVNLYGWLLPADHYSRRQMVVLYGPDEVRRRERSAEQAIVPVLVAARQAAVPVVYVANSAPAIGLANTNIRHVMREHLGIDPLTDYVESCNDPREYLTGAQDCIAYAPALAPASDDHYVRKWTYSGFHATRLDRLLRNLGTRTLLCAGFDGDCDLLCTMIEGHALGYCIILLRGAYTAHHVPALEPTMSFTQRLELYAECSLGFSASPEDWIQACRACAAGGAS